MNENFDYRHYFIDVTVLLLVIFAMAVGSFFIVKNFDVVPDLTTPSTEQPRMKRTTLPLVPKIEKINQIDESMTEQPTSATLLAGGDVMLDRFMRQSMDQKGLSYPFKMVATFIKQHDIAVVNLEGPVTEFPAKPLYENNVTFTFKPDVIPMLIDQGIDLVGLANNHTRDFGLDGYKQTTSYLEANGLPYFGDWSNVDHLSTIVEANGLRFGFVGYHSLVQQNFDLVKAEIYDIRPEVDWLIVYCHWGAEYKTLSFLPIQQSEGQQFIDAGADMVIGMHPHVIQPIEIYKGKPIFYSLGNFVFDQRFSQDVLTGLLLSFSFQPEQYQVDLRVTRNQDNQAVLIDKGLSKQLFADLAAASIAPLGVKQMIELGEIYFSKSVDDTL